MSAISNATVTVIIAGAKSSGKSSVVGAFLSDAFDASTRKTPATLGIDMKTKVIPEVRPTTTTAEGGKAYKTKLIIMDLSGDETYRASVRGAYAPIDAEAAAASATLKKVLVVLVTDLSAANFSAEQVTAEAKGWVKEIADGSEGTIAPNTVTMVLVGAKADAVADASTVAAKKAVLEEVAAKLGLAAAYATTATKATVAGSDAIATVVDQSVKAALIKVPTAVVAAPSAPSKGTSAEKAPACDNGAKKCCGGCPYASKALLVLGAVAIGATVYTAMKKKQAAH